MAEPTWNRPGYNERDYQSNPFGFSQGSVDPYGTYKTKLPPRTPQADAYTQTLKHAEEIVEKKERGALGAYAFKASEIRFTSQNPREQVFVLLRAHPIVNLGWIFSNAVQALIPFLILGVSQFFESQLLSLPIIGDLMRSEAAPAILLIVLLSYYSFIITTVLLRFMNWYYNLYIVTNERILDFDFSALVSYKIKEASISNIEDVKERSIGFLPSLFSYGDIYIQTAAINSNFDFLSVPQPSRVRDIIADLSSFSRRIYTKRISN